eukprot:3627831-Prymnesium_polylepis.1
MCTNWPRAPRTSRTKADVKFLRTQPPSSGTSVPPRTRPAQTVRWPSSPVAVVGSRSAAAPPQ